jgi:hypothetical protein
LRSVAAPAAGSDRRGGAGRLPRLLHLFGVIDNRRPRQSGMSSQRWIPASARMETTQASWAERPVGSPVHGSETQMTVTEVPPEPRTPHRPGADADPQELDGGTPKSLAHDLAAIVHPRPAADPGSRPGAVRLRRQPLPAAAQAVAVADGMEEIRPLLAYSRTVGQASKHPQGRLFPSR